MKKLIILSMALISAACSTARTKSSDPMMRVAIDAESISREALVRLQASLMRTRRFIVVDRGIGFRAVVKEQDTQHQTDRFGASEKYAELTKLYGVGGIIVATEQCNTGLGAYMVDYATSKCIQTLTLLDATTGELLSSSESHERRDGRLEPNWNDAANELIDNYPGTFVDTTDPHKTVEYQSTLNDYRKKVTAEPVTVTPETKVQ